MNIFSRSLLLLIISTCLILPANAGDFHWLDDLNLSAETDSSGYRISLAKRFQLNNVEVEAVIGKVDRASDAYMIFRLSELSHRPTYEVLNNYRRHGHKGWGVMAKSLGIKPGSSQFHALKQGYYTNGNVRHQDEFYKTKGHNNGKGKGKDKGNAKGNGKK
jgi:hypothetical protein